MEKLDFVLFTKLKVASSYPFLSQNLHGPSPFPTYALDEPDGDLKDIKLEHYVWKPFLLNSHGDTVEGFKDFTLTFGSVPTWHIPLLLVGPSVPASLLTQNEVTVFVVE